MPGFIFASQASFLSEPPAPAAFHNGPCSRQTPSAPGSPDTFRLDRGVLPVNPATTFPLSQPRLWPSFTALMNPPPGRSSCQGRFPQAEAFGLSLDRSLTLPD